MKIVSRRIDDDSDGLARQQENADERDRDERYAEFIAYLREHAKGAWDCVLEDVGREYRLRDCTATVYRPFIAELHAYANYESWPMVLRAVARAMEQA